MARRIQRKVPVAARAESSSTKPARASRRRVAPEQVTDFTVQLATLSGAGIPIVRSLSVLEGQTRPGPFREVLADLGEDVSSGTPLSEAMAKHPGTFDELYSSMVRAGESGGVLDHVLARLAEFREKAAEIRAKVAGALVYPQVVLLVALVVVALVIVLVIPKFEDIFESFDAELPQVTQILLNASRFSVRYAYIVIGVPIALWLFHRWAIARPGGYRAWMHRAALRIPILGPILSKSAASAFARTFGTLVQAGVPHLDALEIVRDTSRNATFADAVEDIRRTVREGEGIAVPMEAAIVFDDVITNMVAVGEETGELDAMLLRVADAYDADVDRKLDSFFKKFEPALLIVLAAFVGFIIIALFLPLMKIMSTLGSA